MLRLEPPCPSTPPKNISSCAWRSPRTRWTRSRPVCARRCPPAATTASCRDARPRSQRARRLTEREAELGNSDDLTASERIRLAQRRQHLELSEHELDQREHELLTREAEFEADVLLREERVERWRSELTALEERLERRERDLAEYVDQLQGAVGGGSWPSSPGVTELRRTA